jgi:hypothetical protein
MPGVFKCTFCGKPIATKVRRCKSCLLSFHPGCLDTKLRRDKVKSCCPGALTEDFSRAVAPAVASTAHALESHPSGSGAATPSLTSLATRMDERFDVLAGRLALLTILEERIAAAEARIVVLENDNRALSNDNAALRLAQQAQQVDATVLNANSTRVSELDERYRALSSDFAALKQAQVDLRADRFDPDRSHGRLNPVELIISGVPCSSQDSIPAVVTQVAASLGSNLDDGDIVNARFLVTRDKARKETPLPIVVKLRSRSVLRRLISAKAAKGRLVSSDLAPSPAGPVTTIYLNEALPPDTYSLLIATKTAAKAVGIRFVWHRDGVVFVRKAQGAPVLRISSPGDLTRLASA